MCNFKTKKKYFILHKSRHRRILIHLRAKTYIYEILYQIRFVLVVESVLYTNTLNLLKNKDVILMLINRY